MAELIVVGFKNNMYRASEALNELLAINDDWVVDLHDAVAVYRDYNGKLRVDQSYQMTTGQGAAWGGLWGLLIGATLAIPFTAGVSVALLFHAELAPATRSCWTLTWPTCTKCQPRCSIKPSAETATGSRRTSCWN